MDNEEGFSRAEKTKIVNHALTTASQMLISAIVMAECESHIIGDVLFPDGSKWTLTFKKEIKEEETK